MTASMQLPLDVTKIRELLPHRYPFLFLDRVVEFESGKRIVCIKNVTANEPYFEGHFPSRPVMPGVLLIEAMAQAGGVLSHLSRGTSYQSGLSYLVKVDGARFSRMVGPGDRVELLVTIKRAIRNMVLYEGIARVDGEEVAVAEILCAEAK